MRADAFYYDIYLRGFTLIFFFFFHAMLKRQRAAMRYAARATRARARDVRRCARAFSRRRRRSSAINICRIIIDDMLFD